MRVTKPIDATVDEIEDAKETAVTLMRENVTKTAMDLFYTDNLTVIEDGIKKLNEFSAKSWLLSAMLLYTLIYNKELYLQSGLNWAEYAKESRSRLGLDNRDITDQLSAARFFIKYHKSLERRGFDPKGNNFKLARAELALSLSKNINDVISHMVNDSSREFKNWYQSLKPSKSLPKPTEYRRTDIGFERNKFTIGGVEAVKFSDEIPEEDRIRLQSYMKVIFESIANGLEPAIIPVYDKKEAKHLERLRDKERARS